MQGPFVDHPCGTASDRRLDPKKVAALGPAREVRVRVIAARRLTPRPSRVARCAQALGDHPWPPARRMRRALSGVLRRSATDAPSRRARRALQAKVATSIV